MLAKNQLETINKILKNRILNYSGFLVSDGMKVDIDYKIKLLGYKTLISVGTPYDYLMVGVEFVSLNDDISVHFIPKLSGNHDDSYLFHFKYKLTDDIKTFLSIFVGTKTRIIITEYKFNDENKENLIGEQIMSKSAIRTIVKDVVKKVKTKKSGFFYLPDKGEEYTFTNLPFDISVELTLKSSKKQNDFKVNGYYVPDDGVIEILVLFNPEKIESQLYKLIGELNELIAHELEHGYQDYRGEFLENQEEPEEPIDYYSQDHEISAQYKGFKRVSKLTKKPLEVVAVEWFKKNDDIHGMTDDEVDIVIKKILNYSN
jgi:hypothetical protein